MFLVPLPNRRTTIVAVAALAFAARFSAMARAQHQNTPAEAEWYEAAVRMRKLAESWGDQPYGAVLVMHGQLVGEGPSGVVKNRDPDAHAEREAIRDAQQRLGRLELPGAILYSTSRPCSLCEAAAARAGVSRMYFGPTLSDGGRPGL